MNWALAQKTGSSSAKSVLLILANRANHEGVCWPGIDGIAEQTELSRRAVIAQIRRLIDAKLISVKHRGGTGEGRQSNVYLLHIGGLSAANAQRGNVHEVHGLSASDVGQCARGAPEPKDKPSLNPKRGARDPDWASVPNLNLEAWHQWLDDRRQRRLPKYKTTREAQRLAELSHDDQARCVEYSLDRYKGLVPEKFHEKAKRSNAESFTDIHNRVLRKAGLS